MYLDESVQTDPVHPAIVQPRVGQLEPADVNGQLVSLVVQTEPPRLCRLSWIHRDHFVLFLLARMPAQVFVVCPGVAVETVEGDVSSFQPLDVEAGSFVEETREQKDGLHPDRWRVSLHFNWFISESFCIHLTPVACRHALALAEHFGKRICNVSQKLRRGDVFF